MTFTVTVDEERKLVRIRHEGEMSVAEMFEGRRTVGQLLQKHGFHRMLVDTRAVNEMPDTMGAFEISSSHHQDLSLQVRLAILSQPESLPDLDFVENVAINRGFQVRGFCDEAEAIAWLME
ncbi:MAG TPA: STAS/SEC14 domain-containing protein [Dongiaceae bacterium]|nr:STAS/SEC14 domain-containing protein [Dongiaceae bacterium]